MLLNSNSNLKSSLKKLMDQAQMMPFGEHLIVSAAQRKRKQLQELGLNEEEAGEEFKTGLAKKYGKPKTMFK
jgi:hypothetical protein